MFPQNTSPWQLEARICCPELIQDLCFHTQAKHRVCPQQNVRNWPSTTYSSYQCHGHSLTGNSASFTYLLLAFVLKVLALLLQGNLKNVILALYFQMLLNRDVKSKQKQKQPQKTPGIRGGRWCFGAVPLENCTKWAPALGEPGVHHIFCSSKPSESLRVQGFGKGRNAMLKLRTM